MRVGVMLFFSRRFGKHKGCPTKSALDAGMPPPPSAPPQNTTVKVWKGLREWSSHLEEERLWLRVFIALKQSPRSATAVNANGWATSSFVAFKQSPRSATAVNANGWAFQS